MCIGLLHISNCVETVYELPLLSYKTAIETLLHKSGAVRSVGWIFLHMVAKGRIRDIGQNVLQSSFQTGSDSSPSYFHIFFRNSFLEEACISNIITTICINYILTFINNNAIINNNYGGTQDLTVFFKIPMGTRKFFFFLNV